MIFTNSMLVKHNKITKVKRSYGEPQKPFDDGYIHSLPVGHKDSSLDEQIVFKMDKPSKLIAIVAKAYFALTKNRTYYTYVCAQCGHGTISKQSKQKGTTIIPFPFAQIKGMSCISCECSTYVLLTPYPVDFLVQKVLISDFTDNIDEATYRPIGVFKAIFRSIKIWNRNIFVFNK
jgi:hypothetical protein